MKKISFLFVLLGCVQTDFEDPFPPSLRIDNSVGAIDFRVNGSYELSAVYTDHTGEPADVDINWISSDTDVLSFQGNDAMPHQEGLALITATFNGLSASEAVEVLDSREMINISGFVATLQVGMTKTLTANYLDPDGKTVNVNPIWSSSNTNVATINENGEVNAIASGTTDISVSFGNVSETMILATIEEEVIVDPKIEITVFAMFLDEGTQFQFEADYLNENGEIEETATITWSSSNESILSIDNDGLATANSIGVVNVEASFENIRTSISVEVEGETTERTGSLTGTGYDIEGEFTLSQDNDGDLILNVINYKPDGPGPYFYLSNVNESRRIDGINLGPASTSGNVTINISEIDPSVEISTFNFLVVWCEPFRVRLGVGEFEN